MAEATGAAGLAGLVNNAGVVVAGPLECLPLEALRRQLEVNVVGQVAVTQAFLPLLRAARGRVVNMGSLSGRLAAPFVGPYAASKFALEALTDALRLEVRPFGIEVAIVEPGAVATPRLAEVRRDGPPEPPGGAGGDARALREGDRGDAAHGGGSRPPRHPARPLAGRARRARHGARVGPPPGGVREHAARLRRAGLRGGAGGGLPSP